MNLNVYTPRTLQGVIAILTQFEAYGVTDMVDIRQRLNSHIQSVGSPAGRVSKRIQKPVDLDKRIRSFVEGTPNCPKCFKKMSSYLYDKNGVSTLNLDNVQDGEYFCVDCSIGQYVENPFNKYEEVV